MKTAITICCFMIMACGNSSPLWTDANYGELISGQGVVSLKQVPYTGYVYRLYANGDTEYVRQYLDGKLSGESRGWYEDGGRQFVYHYKNDIHEGLVEDWFPNGRPYRRFNYREGHEEGMQTMYWDNGTIRANYEVKNGRKYGFTGVKNCSTQLGDSLKRVLASGM